MTRTAGIVNVELGSNVSIVEPVNIYGCRIGDGCFVGPFVEIQKDGVIGANTRLEIWDAMAWQAYEADQNEAFSAASEEVLPGVL